MFYSDKIHPSYAPIAKPATVSLWGRYCSLCRVLQKGGQTVLLCGVADLGVMYIQAANDILQNASAAFADSCHSATLFSRIPALSSQGLTLDSQGPTKYLNLTDVYFILQNVRAAVMWSPWGVCKHFLCPELVAGTCLSPCV